MKVSEMTTRTIGELQGIAASSSYAPLPADSYAVEVTGADFVSKVGKNPYFKVEFTVVEGAYARRKVWTNIVLGESEGSIGYFFNKLAKLGLDSEFWNNHPNAAIDDIAPEVCQRLIGRPAVVLLKIRDYQGTLSNEVDKITAATTLGASGVAQAPVSRPAGVPPTLPPGI